MLPAITLSVFFIGIGLWLYRHELRSWSWLPFITGGLVLLFTLIFKLDDARHVQLQHDVDVLLSNLADSELYQPSKLTTQDAPLFLASSGSLALARTAALLPARKRAIDSVLLLLADYAANPNVHPQWRKGSNWDQEVYFLAHAGAILGHYQLITGGTEYQQPFMDIAKHLAGRLNRSRYKHLISRPAEDFYRPADNVAALYVVRLYDRLTGQARLKAVFEDWSRYLANELYYAESRLPCAAFSETNRCHLEPTATATGLYIAYRAAARSTTASDVIPWREWLHYFGTTSLSPFSLSVRPNMRDGHEARFCDQGAHPLTCDAYEQSVGLWAAAAYGADYTYFRLYSANVLSRWLYGKLNFAMYRPRMRTRALTSVALRTIGETY